MKTWPAGMVCQTVSADQVCKDSRIAAQGVQPLVRNEVTPPRHSGSGGRSHGAHIRGIPPYRSAPLVPKGFPHIAVLCFNKRAFALFAVYIRTAGCYLSHSSGTYVRSELPQKLFISGLATASIPIKPQTLRPAGLVTLLQCSRLYLPAWATKASLKLRAFRGERPFSSHHIL